jgi:non-ribosomal peptide synthetase component F/aryl carrier-like protein
MSAVRSGCTLESAHVGASAESGWSEYDPIPVDPGRIAAPLTFSQRSLWLQSRLQRGGGAGFHLPLVLHLKGTLFAPERLQAALDGLIERHAMLRTVFRAADGEVEQRVLPLARLPVLPAREIDPAALPDQLSAHHDRPFDLERELPIRAALFRIAPDEHVLSLILHHIACDGWSIALLFGELRALYLGEDLAPLPLQFGDYAAWQARAAAATSAETLRFYREGFAEAAVPLALPKDAGGAGAEGEGADAGSAIAPDLRDRLRAFGRARGTTDFAPLLCAYAVLIAQFSGQERFLVGTPVARRDREETEGLIGCFASTVPIAFVRPLERSFAALVGEVHRAFLATLDQPEVSWEQVASALSADRSSGGNLLCQAVLALQNASPLARHLPSWGEIEVFHSPLRRPAARFELLMTILPTDGTWHVNLEYAPAQIDPGHAEAFVQRFPLLLDALLDAPDRPIRDLDLTLGAPPAILAAPAAPVEDAAPETEAVPGLPEGWGVRRGRIDGAEALLLTDPDGRRCLAADPSGTRGWRPAPGTEARILDAGHKPKPVGCIGALFVGDAGADLRPTGLRARVTACGAIRLAEEDEARAAAAAAAQAQAAQDGRPASEASVETKAEAEAVLTALWSELLGRAVDPEDNVFAVGGDSILCLKVQAAARRRGVAFAIEDMFRNQTIRALAAVARIEEGSGGPASTGAFELVSERDRARLPRRVRAAHPLSGLQAGMLYHNRLDRSGTYHDVIRYRLEGPYDLRTLREAVAAVVARHDVFAATIDLTTYSEPLQLVWDRPMAEVRSTDLRPLDPAAREAAIEAWMDGELKRGFADGGEPLVRVALHALEPERAMLSFSFHHAMLDGWSEATLLREILDCYDAEMAGRRAPAEEPAISYRDFIAAEQAAVEDPAARAFWAERLRRPAVLEMPPPDAMQGQANGRGGFALDPARTERLGAIAAAWKVPFKSLLLAWHARVLARITGADDVVTGMVFNGRPEGEGSAAALGMYLNTLPVHIDGTGRSWSDLARACRDEEAAILPYRRYPLAFVRALAAGRSVFSVAFNYTHFHVAADGGGEAPHQLRVVHRDGIAKSSLGFLMNFSRDPATGTLIGLFDTPDGYGDYAAAVRDLYLEELDGLLQAGDPAGASIHAAPRPALELRAGADDAAVLRFEIIPDAETPGTDLRAAVQRTWTSGAPLRFGTAAAAATAAAGAQGAARAPEPRHEATPTGAARIRSDWPVAATVAGEGVPALMLSRAALGRSVRQLQALDAAGDVAVTRAIDWSSRQLLTCVLAEAQVNVRPAALAATASPALQAIDAAAPGRGLVWCFEAEGGGCAVGWPETGLCLTLEPSPTGGTLRPAEGSALGFTTATGARAAPGAMAELSIRCEGLSWGYPGDARLTADRFRPDARADAEPGARVYRTGIAVRADASGGAVIEGVAGRIGLLRGRWVRKDLIAAVAQGVEGVARALVEEDAAGEPRLRLWLAPGGDWRAGDAVSARLAQCFPDALLPPRERYVLVGAAGEAGASDRTGDPGDAERTEPEGPVARVVAAVWGGVLKREEIDPHEDFFKGGGDSVRAMRVMAQLEQLFEVELPLVLIFKNPTAASLAEAIEGNPAWRGHALACAEALCMAGADAPAEEACA